MPLRFGGIGLGMGFGVALALASSAGCSSATPTESPADGGSDAGVDAPYVCPSSDMPSACPSTAPSWSRDVQPIVARRCGTCHYDGGSEADSMNLSTYAAVYAERGAVLSQVYACRMPPAGEPRPTADERAALLGWFVCGAPQN